MTRRRGIITKTSLNVTVLPALIRDIDTLRGQVPRSRIVENVLTAYVETENTKKGVRRSQPSKQKSDHLHTTYSSITSTSVEPKTTSTTQPPNQEESVLCS